MTKEGKYYPGNTVWFWTAEGLICGQIAERRKWGLNWISYKIKVPNRNELLFGSDWGLYPTKELAEAAKRKIHRKNTRAKNATKIFDKNENKPAKKNHVIKKRGWG